MLSKKHAHGTHQTGKREERERQKRLGIWSSPLLPNPPSGSAFSYSSFLAPVYSLHPSLSKAVSLLHSLKPTAQKPPNFRSLQQGISVQENNFNSAVLGTVSLAEVLPIIWHPCTKQDCYQHLKKREKERERE